MIYTKQLREECINDKHSLNPAKREAVLLDALAIAESQIIALSPNGYIAPALGAIHAARSYQSGSTALNQAIASELRSIANHKDFNCDWDRVMLRRRADELEGK
jgi:hypothetical protein